MSKKPKAPQAMHESLQATATVVTALINSEEKRVPLILSDETQVIRWDWLNGMYNLTLKHDDDSIDLKRADILKLFYQHETHGSTPPIGKLENVRLEDGKLKAEALFDAEDEFAMEIFGKMERGFLESVSVGVTILNGKMTEYKSKPNEYTATKWELNEVSIVNIPAIPSAKIGLTQEKLNKGEDMELSDITVDFLQENLPDVVAVFTGQGFEDGKKEGITLGIEQGLTAETERIVAIEALSVVGYEDIIAAAKLDRTATPESVMLAIHEKLKNSTNNAKNDRAKDGENLAQKAKELGENLGGNEDADEKTEAEQGVDLMQEASKSVRGEK